MSRSRSYFQTIFSILALAALCAAISTGCTSSSSPAGSPIASSEQSTPTSNVIVNGRGITPAGTTSAQVGDMPLNIVISPDGKYAVTTSIGMNALLCTLRVSDGSVVNSISYPSMDSSSPNNGLFYGLVFDPTPHDNNTYTLYAA